MVSAPRDGTQRNLESVARESNRDRPDELTLEIFSGDFAEPRVFDFAPAFIGGSGRYSMRIAGRTPMAPIPYQVEITPLPGGSGEAPPTIAGTLAAPFAMPTVSPVGLALLAMAIAGGGLAALRRRAAS